MLKYGILCFARFVLLFASEPPGPVSSLWLNPSLETDFSVEGRQEQLILLSNQGIQANMQWLLLRSAWYMLFCILYLNAQIDWAFQDLHTRHCHFSLFCTSELCPPGVSYSWCLESTERCSRYWEDPEFVCAVICQSCLCM